MKHNTIPCPAAQGPQYPNAADSTYFTDKALEILAGVLSGVGAVTAMLLLLIMA